MSRTAHSRHLILGFHLLFTLCYLMIVLLCTYIAVSIFDYTFTEIAEIQLTSFGDLIHAAILLVSCFFIGLIFMLILSYAPSISKEIVSRPFRSEPENRF